jgi:hypothetical protein
VGLLFNGCTFSCWSFLLLCEGLREAYLCEKLTTTGGGRGEDYSFAFEHLQGREVEGERHAAGCWGGGARGGAVVGWRWLQGHLLVGHDVPWLLE